MSRLADALSDAVAFGRRAFFRRSFAGSAAMAAGALGIAGAAEAAEARALYEPTGPGFRRVVTGNNAAGKSYVMKDEQIKYGEVWRSLEDQPLGAGMGNDPNVVLPGTRDLTPGQKVASRWYHITMPAKNAPFNRATAGELHRTSTLSYVMITHGQVTVILEEGEVTIHAGDLMVMRNAMHGWHNAGSTPVGLMIAQYGVG